MHSAAQTCTNAERGGRDVLGHVHLAALRRCALGDGAQHDGPSRRKRLALRLDHRADRHGSRSVPDHPPSHAAEARRCCACPRTGRRLLRSRASQLRTGVEDNFASTDAAVNGVSVRLEDADVAGNTQLLDMTPGSSLRFLDSALAVGRTFTDPTLRYHDQRSTALMPPART